MIRAIGKFCAVLLLCCSCTRLLFYLGEVFYIETDSLYGREICLNYVDVVWVRYVSPKGKIDSVLCKPGALILEGYISNYSFVDDWLFVEQKKIPSKLDTQFIEPSTIIRRKLQHIPDSTPFFYFDYTEEGREIIKENSMSLYWALNQRNLAVYGPYTTLDSLQICVKAYGFNKKVTILNK